MLVVPDRYGVVWLLAVLLGAIALVAMTLRLSMSVGNTSLAQWALLIGLMFPPATPLLVFAALMEAGDMLRRAGIPVRWWGMSKARIELLSRLHCRVCGYDLRGLTGVRCPECGGEIPAADRASLATSQASGELRQSGPA